MSKKLSILILTFISMTVYCQNDRLLDELNGFRLGQYKSVVYNEFGSPDTNRVLDDSTLIDFYYIDTTKSTHLAFVYLPNSDEIYSIQITGEKSPISFYGLNLSDNSVDILSKFPQADTIIYIEFNNQMVQTWKYYDKNYSFVVIDNKLNSIKIWDDFSRPDYTSDDYELPDLDECLKTIKTLDNRLIGDILSPNLEVFYCENVLSWKNSMNTDINNSKSSVYDFILNSQYGLITLSKFDTIPADLNIRFIENYGTFPVFKLPKGELIQEIVFNYQQGRYKIWEIKYECENNN